ncbi:MAG: type IV pilin protein [Gammaproteobacteria bacterium]
MKQNGFTLMELLITLVIIGVLVVIAIPTYQSYMHDAARKRAELNLETAAQHLEQTHMTEHVYPENFTVPVEDEYYIYQYDKKNHGFLLKAKPKLYADDCGILSLDSSGAKSASNGSEEHCW